MKAGSSCLAAAVGGLLVLASPAAAQKLYCVNPPETVASEAACRVELDSAEHSLRITLQLRGPDNAPITRQRVDFVATNGQIVNSANTDRSGYVDFPWSGNVADEPVVITASASRGGITARKQIRITQKDRAKTIATPYIIKISPDGSHSAFAGRYLNEDIEVEIQADAVTCNRTVVTFEYMSVGHGDSPQPTTYDAPALWNEMDHGRLGCAAQLKWLLSPAVGEQTLRAWIKRDSAFVPPTDPAGVQRYLRPFYVHAIAHALPAFLLGAAGVEASRGSKKVPKMVGLDLSFPTLADVMKHHGAGGLGGFVDRTRVFVGTELADSVSKNVYVGVEPLVMLIGPRAANLPVAIVTGQRLGRGRNRWFIAGLINAASIVDAVAKGFGLSK